MSKTYTVKGSHSYASPRGLEMTVDEALAWASEHEVDKDGNPRFTLGDLAVYGVFRLMALNKDNSRFAAGEVASRIYAPRTKGTVLEPVGGVVIDFKEAIRSALAPKAKARKAKAPKAEPVAKAEAPAPAPKASPADRLAKARAAKAAKAALRAAPKAENAAEARATAKARDAAREAEAAPAVATPPVVRKARKAS